MTPSAGGVMSGGPASSVSYNENRKGTGGLDKMKVISDLGRSTCSGMVAKCLRREGE